MQILLLKCASQFFAPFPAGLKNSRGGGSTPNLAEDKMGKELFDRIS